MNYKELIRLSKIAANEWRNDHTFHIASWYIDNLCSAVETLLKERDSISEKLHGKCDECTNADTPAYEYPCYFCHFSVYGKAKAKDHWKWRGLKKGDTK